MWRRALQENMSRRNMKKRLLFCAISFMVFVLTMRMLYMDVVILQRIVLFAQTGDIGALSPSDSDLALDEPKSENNIFFIATSDIAKQDFMLSARQACAVESAAKMNPNMNVYLLFVCLSTEVNQTRKFFDQLESYPNVRIRRVYLDKYVKNTAMQKWYEEGAWNRSHWPATHISEVLRYLTLWRYAGIYLDLDVIVTKCLEDLRDFAARKDLAVSASAIGFSDSSLGRHLADICVLDLRYRFRGDLWGHNGPGVITRTLERICYTNDVQVMTPERCGGFKLLPSSAFYPIDSRDWRLYFDSENKNYTLELVKKARAIHLWDNLGRGKEVRVDSDVPYAIIAREYCPNVIANCGEIF